MTARWLVDVEFLFATRILDGTMTLDAVPDMARRYVLPGLLPRETDRPIPSAKVSATQAR
jgi:hypothetical protein